MIFLDLVLFRLGSNSDKISLLTTLTNVYSLLSQGVVSSAILQNSEPGFDYADPPELKSGSFNQIIVFLQDNNTMRRVL
ncbi:MAG: hypothetical protein EOM06_10260 [Sphingobacteriia bacterium]|nr:hypothetical protein [Sphingobacteriia bacterium]